MARHSSYEGSLLRVKICGLTREDDLRWAAKCGADFLGMILCQGPRHVPIETAGVIIEMARGGTALPPVIGVLMDPDEDELENLYEAGFDGVQLHGQESPDLVREIRARYPELMIWKAIRVKDESDLELARTFPCDAVLFDAWSNHAAGGTGQKLTVAPEKLRDVKHWARVVIAGGLDPVSVIDTVVDIEPWAVDVASGVEIEPGIKDPEKVKEFIENAKAAASLRAFASLQSHEEGHSQKTEEKEQS